MKRLPIIVFTLTSGCATFSNFNAPQKVDPTGNLSGSSIVIISTGAPGSCVQSGTNLNIALAGSIYGSDGVNAIYIDNYTVKSDFSDHHGNISAFRIAPGSYQLYPSPVNPMEIPVTTPKAEFSINPGEVVYLGEFYLHSHCALKKQAEIRDQEQRDYPLLKRLNPKFEGVNIVKRIPKFSGYLPHK